jgi:hypothetical protein
MKRDIGGFGFRTKDLGGSVSTTQMGEKILEVSEGEPVNDTSIKNCELLPSRH